MLSDNTSRLTLNTPLACFFCLRRREYDFAICIRGRTLDPPLIIGYEELNCEEIYLVKRNISVSGV